MTNNVQDPWAVVSETPAPQAGPTQVNSAAPAQVNPAAAQDPWAVVSETPATPPKPKLDATANIDIIDKLAANYPLADRINKGLKEGVEAGFGLHDIDANDHPYTQALSQTWDNLKNAAKQSYDRMGGAPGFMGGKNPSIADKATAVGLTPVDMLASGIEGMASMIETGSKELIAGSKSKDPQAIARGFAKLMSGVGQAAAGAETPDSAGLASIPSKVSSAAKDASAVVGEVADKAGKVVDKVKAGKAANVAQKDFTQAYSEFKQAVPSTKSAPYERADYDVARNHLEPHHENVEPIRGVQHTVDALDHSIEAAENKVSEHVGIIPNEPIATNVLDDVRAELSHNERGEEFVNAGMKEIEGLNLEDIKMDRADKVRRQLNQENRGILKHNNYDIAAAEVSDPGFAARQAAAESLRNGIYDQLEAHGIEGVRELRQEEGSLIKVRNAAQNQIQNAEKTVRGSGNSGAVRKAGAGIAKLAATGAGAYVAGAPGAIAGSVLGDVASDMIAPGDISRDQLLENSFNKKVATGDPQAITVDLKAPEPKPVPVGTQGELNAPAATPGVPEQPSLFGQVAPHPSPMGGMQSVQNQLAMLQKEIRPLKAILNDPVATQAAKVEAARKLANLPLADFQDVTAESGPGGEPPAKLGAKTKSAPKAAEPEEDGIVEEKEEKAVKNNASGESSASQEAINRSKGEKAGKVQRFRIDTRSGKETPLHGVDAVDAKAGPHDRIVIRRPGQPDEIVDEGHLAKPIPRKFKQEVSVTDNMNDPDTRYNAARHEAGHAVISELLNPGSVENMMIGPKGGMTDITPPGGKQTVGQLTRDDIQNMLATSFAGGLSEEGGTTPRHASGDLALRANILGSKASTVGQNASRILSGGTLGKDEMLDNNQKMAAARAKVAAMLADSKVRDQIDTLAQKLTTKGKLTGDEVRNHLNPKKKAAAGMRALGGE